MPPRQPELDEKLITAAKQGLPDKVKELLALGSNPCAKDATRRSSLCWAAQRGHGHVLRLLARHSPASEDRDPRGKTPLMLAAAHDFPECVNILLSSPNPGLEASDHYGLTAVMHAAQEGHVQCAKLLLDAGADPARHDRDGLTALAHAAAYGNADALGLLLSRSGTPSPRIHGSRTPLMLAASAGHLECVELLVPYGGLDDQDLHGRTALHLACPDAPLACCLALAACATPDMVDSNGFTPLMRAAAGRRADLAELLLERGHSMEPKDSLFGMTALMWAAHSGALETAKLLLHPDAIFEKSFSGQTASAIATERNFGDLAALLEAFELATHERQAMSDESADGEDSSRQGGRL
jgi:ankyrin repeat protein